MALPDEEHVETAVAARPHGGPVSRRLVVTDGSRLFTIVAALLWVALVAAPLLISIALNSLVSGAPLVGVALWLALLRVARWLSPISRADALLQSGAFADALEMCERSLSVSGSGAWIGSRRLAWLNRRFSALLGLGRYDEALTAAVDAMEASPDPETLANLALALLRLNRYESAIAAAREVSALTHGRSVRANATLAWAMLARGQPAEAEALASASLADILALAPYVRRENHVASLSALCRAQHLLGLRSQMKGTLVGLRRATRGAPALAPATLLEEASLREDDPAGAIASVREAFTSDPAYTGWYLTQPGAPAFLRDAPEIAPLLIQGAATIAQMNERTPDDEVIARLLLMIQPEERARPALQRSKAALNIQLVTLGATLILLLLWMWNFFIAQSL